MNNFTLVSLWMKCNTDNTSLGFLVYSFFLIRHYMLIILTYRMARKKTRPNK